MIGTPFANDTNTYLSGLEGLVACIGRYSYGVPNVHYAAHHPKSVLKIGSFCSIGSDVEIFVGMGGRHAIDYVTTNPITMVFGPVKNGDDSRITKDDSTVTIGSDVWIGQSAMIMNGVNIGHGAIIGAAAVVRKNVAPYEIVAGNPAQHVRFRFPEDIRDRLLTVAWWDWDDQKIKDNMELFCKTDMYFVLDEMERIASACRKHAES